MGQIEQTEQNWEETIQIKEEVMITESKTKRYKIDTETEECGDKPEGTEWGRKNSTNNLPLT